MIAEGRSYLVTAPWLVIAPGVAIMLCVFLLNLIGSSLRIAVDAHARTLNDLRRLRAQS